MFQGTSPKIVQPARGSVLELGRAWERSKQPLKTAPRNWVPGAFQERGARGPGHCVCAKRLLRSGVREQRNAHRPRALSPSGSPYCTTQTFLPPAFAAVTWSLAHNPPGRSRPLLRARAFSFKYLCRFLLMQLGRGFYPLREKDRRAPSTSL